MCVLQLQLAVAEFEKQRDAEFVNLENEWKKLRSVLALSAACIASWPSLLMQHGMAAYAFL